jgi:hypothetical protein
MPSGGSISNVEKYADVNDLWYSNYLWPFLGFNSPGYNAAGNSNRETQRVCKVTYSWEKTPTLIGSFPRGVVDGGSVVLVVAGSRYANVGGGGGMAGAAIDVQVKQSGVSVELGSHVTDVCLARNGSLGLVDDLSNTGPSNTPLLA